MIKNIFHRRIKKLYFKQNVLFIDRKTNTEIIKRTFTKIEVFN